jgi:16S rRNA (adenine1518-N6/adenine1519-N6)-dimethyltransferase
VRDLLRRYDVRPSRRRGQNFLIDRNALERVLAAAELAPEDGVLEIGPGLGALTRALAERARKVLAVEVDPRLVAALQTETLADLPQVTLIQDDFLALDLADLLGRELGEGRHDVVANIPYSITGPVIARLLEQTVRLKRIVLMVQKEVGRRLAARPGTPEYGALSLLAQFYAEVETVGIVSPRCFFPAPEVDSAIIRLRIRTSPRFPGIDPERFFGVVHAAFQQRRKRLLNSLTGSIDLGWSRERAAAALAAAGIDPGRRGEGLSAEEFAALVQADPQG